MARGNDGGATPPKGRLGKGASRLKAPKTPKAKKDRFATFRQLRQAYTMTVKSDPRLGLILAGVAVGVLAVFVIIGFLVGHPVYLTVIGIPFALMAAMVVFGRRAQRAAYASIEGQKGAAAAILDQLKRGWRVTPGIAATRQQDVLHRAVGRPGIVLVGEGAPSRLGPLFAAERKKAGRVAPDVPVHEFQVGEEDGQLSLRQFQKALRKLPATIGTDRVDEVEKRLSALGNVGGPQLPKGPLPRGARIPRPPR
jgi:hypothetical protein